MGKEKVNELNFIEGSKLLFRMLEKPTGEEFNRLLKITTVTTTIFGVFGLVIMIISHFI